MTDIMHGWFSPTAAERVGYFIYTTPESVRVVVTDVTSTPEPASMWQDLVYVGPVRHFVFAGVQSGIYNKKYY